MMRQTIATAAVIAVAALTMGADDSGCSSSNNEPQQRADVPSHGGQESAGDDDSTGRLETTAEANARATAESYLDGQSFSRKGLIGQLKFEGFGDAAARYGADAVGADWDRQAVLVAQSYLDGQSFSRAGLYDQLVFEGFTPEQATHGVRVAYR